MKILQRSWQATQESPEDIVSVTEAKVQAAMTRLFELNYTNIFHASSLLVALITVVPIHNPFSKCVCFCYLQGPLQLLKVKQIHIFFTSFHPAYVHFSLRLQD